ncbi:twin-arginine translocase subunit TatC [Sanguibacter sp. A247]|uniref:twin-arginine translocase subunit TatC n=1 Tax=unclassified Sanguibacter TaxID=2645534 RepID=UPI003FD70EA3
MARPDRPRDGRMPLRAHLVEARNRIVLAGLGVLLGAIAGWFLYPSVFDLLQAPILEVADTEGRTVALNFAGAFTALDLQIKLAVWLGLILSSPWWLYQAWAFVVPGLTRKEKWGTAAFVCSGVPLFLAGAGLAWWFLPRAVVLLVQFVPAGATNLQDAQSYLLFVTQFILAFGLVFLLPVVMVALDLVGIVRGRTWLRGWRWATVLAFTFAAMMTPTPDLLTMFLMTLPLLFLYAVAVGIALLHDRRVDRRRALAEEADNL